MINRLIGRTYEYVVYYSLLGIAIDVMNALGKHS